jgi:ABC-type multidrug transport system fused ATPase/permease subunit/pSer/pThr/pTyr-binding forkhead associated (FHA) protein
MKGLVRLVLIAVLVSFADVAVEILAALPLKYIPAKLQSCTNDPDGIWSGVVGLFDQFGQKITHANCPSGTAATHTVLGVILFSVALLITATLLDAGLGYLQLFLAAFLGQNLTARLRKTLFQQIQRLSLDWHGKQKKGDIVQRVTGNINDIEKFITDGLVDLLTGALTIIGVAAVMFANSVSYSALCIVIVPALAVVVFSYTSSIKAATKKTAKANAEVADVAVEDVGAITVIKAFDLVERETDRFNNYVDKTRKAGLRAGGLQAQFTPLVTVLVGIGTAIIVGIGAYVAAGNNFLFISAFTDQAKTNPSITIGTVILFITLLGKLFQPMKDLSKLMNIGASASAGAERIQDILDQAPEVVETTVPYNGPKTLAGDIVFENVTFGYIPEKLILKGINLHIPAGKKVALVGLSGGGKTTLVKLIPRFYEATGGQVRIDGRDTREYPLSVLRQNVGMVLQESVLFEGTVLENLKIARPNATMDEVINATKEAHIHDVIMSWPDGYGTLVRNQGKNFSGGQRQRLAIARALLSDAHILVLDEPTAALDVEAELEVMKALEKLVVGRTVLMISHRLSTLGKVDEIIVLKDGQIVEQGTYKDLKARPNGVFADLLGKQKQYDADYAGASMIVPQAEIARLIQQQRTPGFQDQSALAPAAFSNGHGKAAMRKARVIVEVDGKVTGEFELNKAEMRVGRLPANDVHIPSGRVSRLHARIRWTNNAWSIEDLQSLNGLNYQGNLTDHHTFAPGDRVYLAPRVKLTYLEETPQSVPAGSGSYAPSTPMPATPSTPFSPASGAQPVFAGPSTPSTPPARPAAPAIAPTVLANPLPRGQVTVEIEQRVVGTYPLGKDMLTLGRQKDNDIQISSPLVSSHHAMLVLREGRWVIVDRHSRNGLTLQGTRVDNYRLNNGDCIYLAPQVKLRFELG